MRIGDLLKSWITPVVAFVVLIVATYSLGYHALAVYFVAMFIALAIVEYYEIKTHGDTISRQTALYMRKNRPTILGLIAAWLVFSALIAAHFLSGRW